VRREVFHFRQVAGKPTSAPVAQAPFLRLELRVAFSHRIV
jgi:hypothetical protein